MSITRHGICSRSKWDGYRRHGRIGRIITYDVFPVSHIHVYSNLCIYIRITLVRSWYPWQPGTRRHIFGSTPTVGDRYAAHRAPILSSVPSCCLAFHFVVFAPHLSCIAFLCSWYGLLHFLWLWYITSCGLGVQLTVVSTFVTDNLKAGYSPKVYLSNGSTGSSSCSLYTSIAS